MSARRLFALLLVAGSATWTPSASAELRVTKIDPVAAAARAGVLDGDVIESLQRAGNDIWIPADSPLTLQVAVAAGPGTDGLRLRIGRNSETVELLLPAGTLGADTEPVLPEPWQSRLASIDALDDQSEQDAQRAAMRSALATEGLGDAALWLQSQRIVAAARRGEVEAVSTMLAETLALPEVSDSSFPLRGLLMLQTGKALYEASELQAAAALLEDARNEGEQHWPRTRLHAEVLHALGLARIYLGDTDAGSAAFESALTVSRAIDDRFHEAVGIERRGFAQLWRYDNADALASLSDALARARALEPGGEFEIGVLMRLALLHRQTSELIAARDYAQTALALVEARPPPVSAARVWFELGVIASMQYEAREAEQFHRKALAEVEAQQPNSILRTYVLNSLGYLKHLRGDYAGAQRYYAEALAVFAQRDARPDMGMVLQNIAYNAIYAKDYERAEEAAQQALEIYESANFGASGLTSIWQILGQIALETDRIELAEARYRQVEVLLEDAPQDSWSRWDLHYSYGLIDLEHGQPDAALEDFERALQIARRGTRGTIYEALPEFDSGRAHEAAGRDEQAIAHYHVAIDAYEASQRLLGGSLEDQGSFLARHARYYRRMIGLLLRLERNEEAFVVLERYRARMLLDLAVSGSGHLPVEVPEPLAASIAAEQARHDRVLAQLRDAQQGTDRLLIDLESSRRALAGLRDAWISVGSPTRLASVGLVAPASVSQLREALSPGTVLLSYAVQDDASYVLSLRREGLRVVPLGLGAEALGERVAGLRALLGATQPNAALRDAAIDAGHVLYQQLIAPVTADLAHAERLVVLADGALHALPLSALVVRKPAVPGARPQYLIDRVAVSTALSAQHHVAGAQIAAVAADADAPVVLFARDSGEGRDPSDTDVLRGGVPVALPFARDEVRAIGRLFGARARLLIGAEATETSAKAVDSTARILHFATHAVLNEAMPMDSYLVLDDSDARDNGLLQAWEVAQFMRLDADLVTLAACDTLVGKDYGGGAQIGLHSAFMAAGARNVLGTLWSVSDRQTHALMLTFYRALADGMPPDRALQIAQRAAADAAVAGQGVSAWLSRFERLWRNGLAAFTAPAGTHWTAFQLTGTGH